MFHESHRHNAIKFTEKKQRGRQLSATVNIDVRNSKEMIPRMAGGAHYQLKTQQLLFYPNNDHNTRLQLFGLATTDRA